MGVAELQPCTGGDRGHRHVAGPGSDLPHGGHRSFRPQQRGVPDRLHLPTAQHAGQAVDVVGVEVAEQDQGHVGDAGLPQAAVDCGRVRTGVDDDGGRRPGAQQKRLTLADVADDDRPVRRGPGGLGRQAVTDRGDGERGDHQPERRGGGRDDEPSPRPPHAPAAVPGARAGVRRPPPRPRGAVCTEVRDGPQHEVDGCDHEYDQRQRRRGPGHPVRPRDTGGGRVGGPACDRRDPARAPPGGRRQPGGRQRVQQGHQRRQQTQNGCRCDSRRGQQVRRHGIGAEHRVQADEQRCHRSLRGGGDREGVGRRPGQDPAERPRPRGGQQHEACRGDDAEPEAGGPGQPGVQQQHGWHGEGERRQASPATAQDDAEQPDRSHHRGAQHARLGAGYDHERHQGGARGEGPDTGPDAQERSKQEDRAAHERDVRPADGGEMGEPGRPHVVGQVGRDRGGVPDHQAGQQRRTVGRRRTRRSTEGRRAQATADPFCPPPLPARGTDLDQRPSRGQVGLERGTRRRGSQHGRRPPARPPGHLLPLRSPGDEHRDGHRGVGAAEAEVLQPGTDRALLPLPGLVRGPGRCRVTGHDELHENRAALLRGLDDHRRTTVLRTVGCHGQQRPAHGARQSSGEQDDPQHRDALHVAEQHAQHKGHHGQRDHGRRRCSDHRDRRSDRPPGAGPGRQRGRHQSGVVPAHTVATPTRPATSASPIPLTAVRSSTVVKGPTSVRQATMR